MPEWMMLPDELEPKLAVFLLLIGLVLSLSYFGQKGEASAKVADAGRIKRRKKRELSRVAR